MDFVQKNVEKCSEMLYNESSWGSFSCPKIYNFQLKGSKEWIKQYF